MTKVVAIIQARMAASRLPGKVLLDICGKPMLARVIERTRMANLVDDVVVATTLDASDDAVQEFCENRGIKCYRGSMDDVLDRYYQAALENDAEVIVRITADCPLIDPSLVDQTVREFLDRKVDFAATRLPPPLKRTYPIGLDVEVVSFSALQRTWREATQKHEREHVLPYLYETEGRFKIFVLNNDIDYGNLRWTVDTPEDLELLRVVYQRFLPREDFSWEEVLQLFEREPELGRINAQVKHKTYLDTDQRQKP